MIYMPVGKVIRGSTALLIYTVIALIMYLGLYARSEAPLLVGIGLFLVITSYLLTWDLITDMTLKTLRVSYDIAHTGHGIELGINATSPLRLKLPIRLSLICTPHLMCGGDYRLVVNGPQEQLSIGIKWLGVAEILGFIARVSDPLNIVGNSRFIRIGRSVPIEPEEEPSRISGERMPGERVGGMALIESRLGDFMYLRNYDFLEPASNIHWLTSARVNDLISVARSEVGSSPRLVVMEYTPRLLKPLNDKRLIDHALTYLGRLRHAGFTLVLVGNGLVKVLTITPRTSLANLELGLRELAMGLEDRQELINKATRVLGKYVREVEINELMLLLYPERTDHGLSRSDIDEFRKYLRKNALLLISRDSLNELMSANVDLRDVNIIVLGG